MTNLICPDCKHDAEEHSEETEIHFSGCGDCNCRKPPLEIYRTAYAELLPLAEEMADALKRVEPQVKGVLPIQDVKSSLTAYETWKERNVTK